MHPQKSYVRLVRPVSLKFKAAFAAHIPSAARLPPGVSRTALGFAHPPCGGLAFIEDVRRQAFLPGVRSPSRRALEPYVNFARSQMRSFSENAPVAKKKTNRELTLRETILTPRQAMGVSSLRRVAVATRRFRAPSKSNAEPIADRSPWSLRFSFD